MIGIDVLKNQEWFFQLPDLLCAYVNASVYIRVFQNKRRLKLAEIAKNYLLPYLVFDIAYAVYSIVRDIEDINGLKIFTPTYVYWYILCLAFMWLLTSSKIRYSYILATAVVLTFVTSLWIKKDWLFL